MKSRSMCRMIVFSMLLASPAFAATTIPVGIASLDPIGTGCIDGGGYDDPFPSSKGVRAPNFCIHNPCDRSLTKVELGRDIIGREAEDWEWDTYYARYAEICRAEAVNRSTPAEPVTVGSFYGPLIAAYRASSGVRGDQASMLFNNPGTGGSAFPGGPSFGGGGNLGDGTNVPGNPVEPSGPTLPATPPGGGTTDGGGLLPDSGTGGGQSPGGGGQLPGGGGQPPVVPLPLPGLLLLGALGGALTLRRRSA